MSDTSLYLRLGGYDAVAAVVDDFSTALIKDPKLEKYFHSLSENSLKKVRQLTVDFLCETTGGPCFYLGRDMVTTHKGLGINESDWDHSVRLLADTLEKFKVPSNEREEILTLVSSIKDQIVE